MEKLLTTRWLKTHQVTVIILMPQSNILWYGRMYFQTCMIELEIWGAALAPKRSVHLCQTVSVMSLEGWTVQREQNLSGFSTNRALLICIIFSSSRSFRVGCHEVSFLLRKIRAKMEVMTCCCSQKFREIEIDAKVSLFTFLVRSPTGQRLVSLVIGLVLGVHLLTAGNMSGSKFMQRRTLMIWGIRGPRPTIVVKTSTAEAWRHIRHTHQIEGSSVLATC